MHNPIHRMHIILVGHFYRTAENGVVTPCPKTCNQININATKHSEGIQIKLHHVHLLFYRYMSGYLTP